MKILIKADTPLFSGSLVWLVHSERVDDIFRSCVTASDRPITEGERAGAVIATDAELR